MVTHQLKPYMVKLGLATGTQNTMFLCLSAGWNRAKEDNRVAGDNPFRGQRVKVAASKKITRRMVLTGEQLDGVLYASKLYHDRYHPLLVLIANTGLRIGEATNLRWCDLDLSLTTTQAPDGRLITMGSATVAGRSRETVTIDGEKFIVPEFDAKTEAGERTIPIPETVVQELLTWKAKHGKSPLVFVDLQRLRRLTKRIEAGKFQDGERLLTGLDDAFKSIVGKARTILAKRNKCMEHEVQLNPGGWHDLRHTYLTGLANRGLSPHVLKRVAGHEKVETTLELYAHETPHDAAMVVAAMAPAPKLKLVSDGPDG